MMLLSLTQQVVAALLAITAMVWQIAWSLVFGFVLSGLLQTLVSTDALRRKLGGSGLRQVAVATAFGAASSSCSYASAAIAKSLIARGAGFLPSIAFLFASTNLVVELGIVLWQLMGWQFAAAEWVGGILLVAILSVIVKYTLPDGLTDEAQVQAAGQSLPANDDTASANPKSLLRRLRDRETWIATAQSVAMDWSMLRGDLLLGFVIAGLLMAFVPASLWQVVFFGHLIGISRSVVDAMIGPLVAVVSFVCSIGNVPLAAALWAGGVDISGVLAFLYADLIVLPLLDVYRKSFGMRAAVYIGSAFYITMVLTGIIMGNLFGLLHLAPARRGMLQASHIFAIDANFWLNLVALAVVVAIIVILRRTPASTHHCAMHDHA